MLDLLSHLWKHIIVAAAGLIIIARVFKAVFGIDAFGKKLYEGAPYLWKWIMKSAIFRKEVTNTLDIIKSDQKETFKFRHSINTRVESLTLRMDLYDQRSNLMNFKMNREGAITFISDSFLKHFDYSREDILGYGYENSIHEDDTYRVREKWKRCCEKCSRFFDEHKMISKSGEFILCIVRGFPEMEGEGCTGFYGTIDIVEEDHENEKSE